jgi:putative CocE/NonD family hydrolase
MRVEVEFDVSARMRDGVTLRANIYRPRGRGPWPLLLMRTPYGKDLPGTTWCGVDPVQAAGRGFIVVIQDTRGRFASDGVWDPFRFERLDGYDTVEWAARLPAANGRVAMYGGSYCGNTQWLTAIERAPSLAAISPLMTWSDPLDGLLARGGAVELGLAVPWSLENGLDHVKRLYARDTDMQPRVDGLIEEWDGLGDDGYWELPVHGLAVLRRHGVPDLGTIRALDDPAVIDWSRVAGAHQRVVVPTLHIGGWYDVFAQGTLDNHVAMAALGREARLIVGPWTHDTFRDPIGEKLFGMRASRDGLPIHPHGDVIDLQLAWLRRHLVPDTDVELPDAQVRIFVMGRNEWRDESSWPLQRAVSRRWFLRSGGSLTTARPDPDEPTTRFAYDPADPAPTIGGHTVMWPGYPAGPRDQAALEARDDVCVFTSEPLQRDMEVTGRVRVVLCAESSAPSTDWVARLCDVHPDGRSYNLCDGIVRIAQGSNMRRSIEVDLWSTSNVFLAGHRLRVHVTSSSFPRWDRNLNTGRQGEARHEVARQRVHHCRDDPSYIELPTVE